MGAYAPFPFRRDNMKFQYKPNCAIIDYDKMVRICTFDENGFFETDNPKLIKRLQKSRKIKQVLEEKPQEVPKEVPKKEPAEKVYTCKKCKFTTTNMGELLAHYRIDHPKK
jgi:hypothetical protein